MINRFVPTSIVVSGLRNVASEMAAEPGARVNPALLINDVADRLGLKEKDKKIIFGKEYANVKRIVEG